MRYNWDIKRMKKQLLSMEEFLIKNMAFDQSLADDISSEIDNLTEAINNYYRKDLDDKDDDYIDKNHYLLRENYYEFLQIPDYVQNNINRSFIRFKDLNDTYQDITLPRFKATSEELVELVNEFIKWLPTKDKIWTYSFKEFINPENNLLKFRTCKDDDFSGITHFTYYPRYIPYFLINRKYTITDFLTLLHELAHGTVGISGQNKNIYPSELEGWYFQFLGREFLNDNKIVSDKEIKQLEYYDFSIAYDYYLAILLFNVCHKLKCNKKALSLDNIKKVTSKYIDYFDFDEATLKNYLDMSAIERYTYTYSYLLNLDLESSYSRDRELSFYNFNNLVIHNGVITEENLAKNGFTFMHDDYKSLDKKIKRINTF